MQNDPDETVEKGINRMLSLPKRPVPRSNSGPSASSGSEFACFSTVSTMLGALSGLNSLPFNLICQSSIIKNFLSRDPEFLSDSMLIIKMHAVPGEKLGVLELK